MWRLLEIGGTMAQVDRRKIYELVEYVDLTGDGERDFDYYDVFMLVVIVISLVPLVFKHEVGVFAAIDLITACIFIVDYILRWTTADFKLGMEGAKAFLLYPFTFMAIVDLLSILPSLSVLGDMFPALEGLKILYALRALRVLRVFRVVKLARYSNSLLIISRVLRSSRDPLLAVGAFAGAYILVSALIIFNVEPDSFDTFFEAVYWATVSLTAVGYGDIYPVTVIGRLVAMVSSLFGIAIVALPAGIITAGYMNEIHKEDLKPDPDLHDSFDA